MKFYFLFAFMVLLNAVAWSQPKKGYDPHEMELKEDSLNTLSAKIINEYNLPERMQADSLFTKTLVRALKQNHSFQYPFAGLEYISVLHSPDHKFRIFTWQLIINENLTRQHGALQINTSDGKLKLYPLIDKSDITQNITDTIGNHLGWIGAVYYKILLNKSDGENIYTLLGYDENNIRSNRKFIEILRFPQNNEPVFGGAYFLEDTSNTQLKNKQIARYVLEFKKASSPRLNYDSVLNLIVMEHLISDRNEPKKKYTLIPDGDYEGFEWKNGKWNYIKKLFTEVTEEGLPPTPVPLNKQGLFED